MLEKTAPHVDHVHVKLIADMMTFSGDANGFTLPGFRDMIKSAGISAPFAMASFQVTLILSKAEFVIFVSASELPSSWMTNDLH